MPAFNEFPVSGVAAHLEAVLQRIADWPEDSAINLRIVAREALDNYYRELLAHYELERSKPSSVDWA